MSKLALRTVTTGPLFFPATAKLRLVQTKFPVVGAWATALSAIRTSAGRTDGVGDFHVGEWWARRRRSVRASVLRLETSTHHLRRNILPTIVLARVEGGGREHPRSELHVSIHQCEGGSVAKRRRVRGRVVVGTTEDTMLLLNAIDRRVMVLGNAAGKHHVIYLLSIAQGQV